MTLETIYQIYATEVSIEINAIFRFRIEELNAKKYCENAIELQVQHNEINTIFCNTTVCYG